MKPRKISWKERGIAVLKALILVGWAGIVVILAQYALGFILLKTMGQELLAEPIWQGVYEAVVYIIAFLVLWTVTLKLIDLFRSWKDQKKSSEPLASREELGLRGLPTWTDLGLGVVGYVVSLLLAGVIVGIFQFFPWFQAEETQNLGFSPYVVGMDRVIAFLTLAVVAPIAEELIFRGWLYGKVRKVLGDKLGKRGSIVVAILMVSILFGAMHGQWNVGLTVFAMSVVACILREMTGTIYAGMLVHIIRNGLAFYLLYVVGMGF